MGRDLSVSERRKFGHNIVEQRGGMSGIKRRMSWQVVIKIRILHPVLLLALCQNNVSP
jgi:hypothetical protein